MLTSKRQLRSQFHSSDGNITFTMRNVKNLIPEDPIFISRPKVELKDGRVIEVKGTVYDQIEERRLLIRRITLLGILGGIGGTGLFIAQTFARRSDD